MLRHAKENKHSTDAPELTPREVQILEHVARGLSDKEVARVLTIVEKTVKHHMTVIMQKLQVRNRVEAALLFRKQLSRGSEWLPGTLRPLLSEHQRSSSLVPSSSRLALAGAG